MKVSEFSELVAMLEGRKKQLSIAQIKEVMKCINKVTEGEFYKMVRKMDVSYELVDCREV